MLEMDVDKICYLIVKAREFDVKVPPEVPDPGSNPTDDGERVILQDYPNDPTAHELKSFIADLNEDERCQLVALLWVGRGTYSPEDWDDALAEARRDKGYNTSQYLLGEPLLSDFLEEGLSQFDLSCEDFEMGHM
jgi:hypothetical protein